MYGQIPLKDTVGIRILRYFCEHGRRMVLPSGEEVYACPLRLIQRDVREGNYPINILNRFKARGFVGRWKADNPMHNLWYITQQGIKHLEYLERKGYI
ncbi:MAG: hypothetical protein GH150_04640 [Hadesarchaea archaeon]|nr:hypothetical protein [Hadesarchaea archaeon]